MLTCYIIVKPVIEKMLGLNVTNTKLKIFAKLGMNLEKNGKREHFLRSTVRNEGDNLVVYPLKRQDSSLLTTLNNSNSLIKRLPYAPALLSGHSIEVLPFFSEFD